MPNPNFQFQNVSGAGVSQAASNTARIQDQAFQRITSGLDEISNLGSKIGEREEERFNKQAEENVLNELNKIKAIDNVDDLQNYEVNEEALRNLYGNQFGSENFEQGVAQLQDAVDKQLGSLINEEEMLDDRQGRLDAKRRKELISNYNAEFQAKNGRLPENTEFKEGFASWLQGQENVPSGTAVAGFDYINKKDESENSLLFDEKAAQEERLINAKVYAAKMENQELIAKKSYEELGGDDAYIHLDDENIEESIKTAVLRDELKIDGWFVDVLGLENPDEVVEEVVSHANAIRTNFEGVNSNVSMTIQKQLMEEMREAKRIYGKDSKEFKKVEKEYFTVIDDANPVSITKDMLGALLTRSNLNTTAWYSNDANEIDHDRFNTFIKKELKDPKSNISKTIFDQYKKQKQLKSHATNVKVYAEKKAQGLIDIINQDKKYKQTR